MMYNVFYMPEGPLSCICFINAYVDIYSWLLQVNLVIDIKKHPIF